MKHIPNNYHLKESVFKFRDFFWVIAQKTYPFAEKDSQGTKRYLDKAFEERYLICENEFGTMPNMRCTKIFLWQEFLRFWTAIMFWAAATLIDYFFGFPWALILPIFLLVMIEIGRAHV